MTLKYSGKAFRKVANRARLHEESFKAFGGSVQHIVLELLTSVRTCTSRSTTHARRGARALLGRRGRGANGRPEHAIHCGVDHKTNAKHCHQGAADSSTAWYEFPGRSIKPFPKLEMVWRRPTGQSSSPDIMYVRNMLTPFGSRCSFTIVDCSMKS